MNWTGGKLQRSKRANKGIAQIQKAHFARARTQLQKNPHSPPSPFRPNFSRDNADSLGGQVPLFSSRSVRHTGHSRTLRERRSEVDFVTSLDESQQEELKKDPVSSGHRGEHRGMATYESRINGESRRP
jgi:hypothetical protein